MDNSTFKVGDRVKCTDEYSMKPSVKGRIGVIIACTDYSGVLYCVEFDDNVGGHDGTVMFDRVGREGYCWNLRSPYLLKLKNYVWRKL